MYEEFANRLAQTNTDRQFNPVMAHFFLFAFDSSGKSILDNLIINKADILVTFVTLKFRH